MDKTVLFIPGFQENLTSRNYAEVLRAIEKKGYRTKFVTVKWNYRTIDDWVQEVENIYKRYDPQHTVLAGFSFGAMTALVVAANHPPSELWLFSLSPYFVEDLPKAKPSWLKFIGKHRTTAFAQLSIKNLATRIPCKTLIFIGDKEIKKYPIMEDRSRQAEALLPNSQLIVVSNAGHAVELPSYIATIQKEI